MWSARQGGKGRHPKAPAHPPANSSRRWACARRARSEGFRPMANEGASRGGSIPGSLDTTARRSTPVPYIVLVGLDLSEPGGRAWRFAFELAALKGENSE